MTPDCVGPLLRTERLELWRPRPGDLRGLVELLSPDETRRYLGASEPNAQEQFQRLMRSGGSWHFYGYGNFIVRLAGEPDIFGSCGVFHSLRGFDGMNDVPEAGWIIRNDHWGKGIAREAMSAILVWFDRTHGARRVTCMIEDGNAASDRVARALGFEAYRRQEYEGAMLTLYDRLRG